MLHNSLILVAILATAAAVSGDDRKSRDELQRLEGAYTLVGGEVSGKKSEPNEMGIDTVLIKGDRLTVQRAGKDVKTFGITVDPSKKPAAMDWINLDQKEAMPLPAIYELDGDQLRICFPMLPAKGSKPEYLPEDARKPPTRPTSFETKDKPIMMLTAKRMKS